MKNRFITSTLIVAAALLAGKLNAQIVTPDLLTKDKWTLVNRSATVTKEGDKFGIFLNEAPGDGAMILKDYDFSNGTIELDIKGKDLMGQSFVGIAFHVQSNNAYDAIYFRPFNFFNTDTARRSRAVQYIAMPNFPWEKLRKDSPGKYENKVKAVPDPNAWFHVKIQMKGKHIQVFVNDEKTSCLSVQKLSSHTTGSIALWVGNNSSGSFANLKITPQ